MADKDERLFAERNDFQLGIFLRIRDEAEVNNIAEDIVINLVRPAILDVDVHGRVALHEPLDIRRQVVQTDGVNRRHADRAGNDVLQFLQLAVQRLISLDDLLAVIIEHLAFAREAELLFAAFDQQRFEHALHHADLLADRGLCNSADLGGLGEAFRFDQIAINFQTLDLHK